MEDPHEAEIPDYRRRKMRVAREGLPGLEAIGFDDSPSGYSNIRTYFGRSVDDIEIKFRENPDPMLDSIRWLMPEAFCFYMESVARYIRSTFAEGNYYIFSFAGVLEFYIQHFLSEIRPAMPLLLELCEYIVSERRKFDLDSVDIERFRSVIGILSDATR